MMRVESGQSRNPRLPVYFVIDCSGTMHGEKIASVRRGVAAICETLKRDPRSAATVYISAIWFNDSADRTPLMPIGMFALPDAERMQVLGKTALGKGLRVLNQALDTDLIRGERGPDGREVRAGDYRPMIFVMTDGQPSDPNGWPGEAALLRSRTMFRPLHVIGLAIGEDADVEVIGRMADVVLKTQDELTRSLGDYFNWVSESVLLAREHVTQHHLRNEALRLPPTPKTLILKRDLLELG